MLTHQITKITSYTKNYLQTFMNEKQARYLNNFLWISFAAVLIFGLGYRAGTTIGELIYNLSY